MSRDRLHKKSLGIPLQTLVKEARLLLVGAGGIGCELLKNLVLLGFGEIHIVDLDTIDLSNLNRQFLFRHEHIKKSKALVAKEAAHKFNPNVKLEAYSANIFDDKFNVDWFRGFTMVFNALDNLQARRQVNLMCIAANIPLVESGTTGFNGQVQVIKKNLTACYDCTPKQTPKNFPTCTIRSTPSQPIHCIVWAKSYLLNEVFGTSEDAPLDIDEASQENSEEIANLQRETAILRKIKESMNSETFPQLLFDKVFKDDIERLRMMESLWKTRRAPESLDYVTALERASKLELLTENILNLQRPWTMEENLLVFKDSLKRLTKRIIDLKSKSNDDSAENVIIFDKDDEDTLDFVTASANLRSSIFGIENKSKFDVKQMAGNIIPAIATTNAIVAGLCVLQSFKILKEDYTASKDVFLSPFASNRLLASDQFQTPNPECAVCSAVYNRVLIDLSNCSLKNLVQDFLISGLKYGEEIEVNLGKSHLLYDVDETVNLERNLRELGIKDGSFITVIDDDCQVHGYEKLRVNLVLIIQELKSPAGERIQSLDIPISTSDEVLSLSKFIPFRKPNANFTREITPVTTSNRSLKRSRSIEPSEKPNKKSKVASTEAQDLLKAMNGVGNTIIEIDDDDDGAIVIED
ncbi:Ubiquitin-activating enzyme [Podosphaera aphanis]|nr:Ubiquitin-activating enzyme [Podosphaera aphanis]